MSNSPLDEYNSLEATSLTDDLKIKLIELNSQQTRFQKESELAKQKWWWSTPLMIALTGGITIALNFLFDFQREDQKADHISLQRSQEFQYEVMQRELGKFENETERAQALLFLVRAGVLKNLNSEELKKMALAKIDKGDQNTIPQFSSTNDVKAGSLPDTINSIDEIYEMIARWEGGYVNNPFDPNGATNFGIDIAMLSKHLGRKVTNEDIKNLSKDTAKEIILNTYYSPLIKQIQSYRIQAALLNISVNSGPIRANKLLSKALECVTEQTDIDHTNESKLINLANAYINEDELISAISFYHEQFYRSLTAFNLFGRGWLNRLANFRPSPERYTHNCN